MSFNIVFVCVFALSVNFISCKTLRNALLLDAEVEYQRGPWLTVDIQKSSSEKGSYNFKFNFHVWRDTKGAALTFQKWPIFPLKFPDNTFYNVTLRDTTCEFIAEDFFQLFDTGNFSQACVKGDNTVRKGNYTFEYNIDQAKLRHENGIGTAIYYFYVDHAGGPLLIMKMLVDTNVIAVRKYTTPLQEHTTEHQQTTQIKKNISINLV